MTTKITDKDIQKLDELLMLQTGKPKQFVKVLLKLAKAVRELQEKK